VVVENLRPQGLVVAHDHRMVLTKQITDSHRRVGATTREL
jgi:hypothetical protein